VVVELQAITGLLVQAAMVEAETAIQVLTEEQEGTTPVAAVAAVAHQTLGQLLIPAVLVVLA
jgi:hypothetical protein